MRSLKSDEVDLSDEDTEHFRIIFAKDKERNGGSMKRDGNRPSLVIEDTGGEVESEASTD